MHPRKFVRDSIGFAFSQYVVRAALMLRGLVAARLLGPELYGGWNAIQILIDYGGLAPLGSQQGLDQMVPPRIVGDDARLLSRVKRAALFNIGLTTGVYVAGCVLFGAFGPSRLLHEWGVLGVGAAMVCVLATNLSNFQTSILRSHGDITTISRWMMIQGAIGSVLGLSLLPVLHAWGLLLGWLAGCVSAFAYSTWRARVHAPLVARPSSDSPALAAVGLPMFVFIASSLVMRTFDRILILHYLSTVEMGYYSLSLMALTFLLYLPDSLTYVSYPRLLRDYGASGQDPAAIRPQVLRVLRAMSVLVPVMCGIAFVMSRPVVLILLPKYLPGVRAMRLLGFGAAALAFGNFAAIVLMTLGRRVHLLAVSVAGALLYIGFDATALALHRGITGVAWGTLAAYALTGAFMLYAAFRGLGDSRRSALGVVARAFAPAVIALGLALALDRWLPLATTPRPLIRVLRTLAAMVLFVIAYAALVRPFSRGLGIRRLVTEFNLPVIGPLLRRGAGAPPEGGA